MTPQPRLQRSFRLPAIGASAPAGFPAASHYRYTRPKLLATRGVPTCASLLAWKNAPGQPDRAQPRRRPGAGKDREPVPRFFLRHIIRCRVDPSRHLLLGVCGTDLAECLVVLLPHFLAAWRRHPSPTVRRVPQRRASSHTRHESPPSPSRSTVHATSRGKLADIVSSSIGTNISTTS